ncbi:hypothetical protein [Rhodoligotrophos ferricapiens]|uniref:hypothetical protein n=1 Tax=Rhodoligotrophos ferricapiens TaxID=3069264 RepID=UPI00315DC6C8
MGKTGSYHPDLVPSLPIEYDDLSTGLKVGAIALPVASGLASLLGYGLGHVLFHDHSSNDPVVQPQPSDNPWAH